MTKPDMDHANLLLTDVEVRGRRLDVRVRQGRIVETGANLPRGKDEVVEGRGGALLPGLHDHHLHLLAMAAARRSVQTGPPHVRTAEELGRALRSAPAEESWIRGVGYHESVAGPLDRRVLDAWVPNRPVRIQHRSGALWVLNSAALRVVSAGLDDSADVERDHDGTPNGRLWRYDERLARALPDQTALQDADLAAVADALFRLGITGVTDATPGLDERAVGLLGAATPLRVHLLGGPTPAAGMSRISVGPRKLLLRDHDLPTYDELCAMVDPDGRGHARSPVAVHCVTRESLILTLAVLSDLGSLPGDRIEHASVVPAGVEAELARLGLTVVPQPDLLRTRGDVYLHDVDADDLPHLYPWASLVRAGVLVAPSSDAPFGDIEPWQVIRSARDRQTRDGTGIGPDERVTAEVALRGYLTAPEDPGGPSRRVEKGADADLCLLSVPLSEALAHPESSLVRLALADGRPVATTS